MDDVRIWNDARSATEIADNYNQRLGGGEDNLYAYYTFDDVKGGVVDDKAAGDHDAVLKAAATAVSARNVLSLDGTNDYVSANLGTGTISTNLTLEAWVMPDQFGIYRNPVNLFGSSTGEIWLQISDAGVFNAWVTGSNVNINSSNTLTAGQWVHLAVTFDGSTIRLYENGDLVGSQSGVTMTGLSGNQTLHIGRNDNASNFFDGLVDEVRIWNVTRTQAEIQLNMNEKVDGTSTGLVAQYSFDADNPANSGTVDNGEDTAARDGTLNSGAAVVATTSDHIRAEEAPLAGPSGNIMDVADSGARDDMNTTFSAGTFTSAVTMETWVNFDRANTQDNFMALLTTGNGGVPGKDNPRFVLYKTTDGRLGWFVQDDDGSHGATFTTAAKVFDIDVWYHVAATYDTATDQTILYVNGEAVTSQTITDFTLHAGVNPVFAAGSDNGGVSFDGQMDNVRVWTTARAADEVREGMTQSYHYDTSGLVGQYTLDDVAGTTVRDTGGVSLQNGTLTGTATIVDSGTGGPVVTPGFDTAANFDGTNDTITFSSTIAPTGNAARTIMLWAKTASSGDQTLVSYGTTSSGGAFSLGINSWATGGRGYGVSVDIWGSAITFQPLTATDDGQWHHYAVVVPTSAADGTISLRDLQVYQDGILLSVVSALAGNDDHAINTASGGLSLGQWVDGSVDFNGQMAEVSAWSKALSGGEIRDYMTQQLSGEESGLSGYWKLDEGTGTTAGDTSANHNNGTLTNTTWTTGLAPDIEGNIHHIVEDGTASGQMTHADVTGTPTYTLIGNPTHGSVDLDGSTGQYTYTPTADYQGQDSFTIRAAGATSGVDDESVFVSIGNEPSLTENHALKLDGSGDYVDIGIDGTFATGSDDFTIEAWIKTSYNGARQDIFSFGNAAGTTNTGGYFYVDQTTGNLRYGQSGVFGPTGGAVADGAWHHVAVTNTSGTMQLYIDGTASGASQAMSPNMTSGSAVIGRSVIGATNYFNGQIDEVRVWDKARAQSEIQTDMDRLLNGDEANLTGYWDFNEGAGNIAADGSANNNDGTLVGDAAHEDLSSIDMANSQTYKGMLLGEDADGDGLSYAVSSNPDAGTFTLDTNHNTYTYVSDASDGDHTVSIDVTDSHGQTSTETLTFHVT